MQYFFLRWASVLALVLFPVLLTVGCGESGDGSGGTAGSGATGGSGGTGGGTAQVVLPQCTTNGYQMIMRGLVEPLGALLRYIDQAPGATRPGFIMEDKSQMDIYSRFTWDADDVDAVNDPTHTAIRADFIESTGLNPANLDDGIQNMEVVLVPWEMTLDGPTTVGEGRFSISGLGPDTVRATIVDFNPWYTGLGYCRFEITLFDVHLDLTDPSLVPTSAVIGFTAEGLGFMLDNGAIIYGGGDTASFSGEFNGQPVSFEVDFGTDTGDLTGTFAGIPIDCTIDLETFDLSC